MRRESQERASQQSGVGTPDMDASDQVSSSSGKGQRDEVAPETPERVDGSAAPREGNLDRDGGRDSVRVGGTPDLAEDNIVPEGFRSER
jgi:hypothetical protein